jgi:predicted CxxxxCH...CXXCH cytochrome family protein
MLDRLPREGRAVVSALLALVASACSSSASTAPVLGPAGAVHVNHLQGGAFASGGTCADCHATTGFVVDFSQNPLVQSHGGAFDPTTKTCSNVYCHGNFTFQAVSGSMATPSWADTTPLTCTSCHGMPPTGHPPIGASADARSCSGCHAATVNPDGTINLASGAHMNGKAEAATGSCTSCHGDPARVGDLAGTDFYLTSSPPVAPQNAPAFAVGAHLAHLNPVPASAMASPVACVECHVVPADSAHATAPPAQKVVFGPLSTSNGTSPTWDAGSAGCAASYCHGNFAFNGVSGASATPLWTDTAPMTCLSCHGMPPTGHPPLAGAVTAATCNGCHPRSVDPQGFIVVSSGTHLNGKAETSALGCTSCHGDAMRTASLAGTDVNLASSPPVAPASAPAFAVGAHLGHVNPAAATALMGPVACGECHVVPTDSTHANHPPAQSVVFGPLSTANGAAPTWSAGTAGCAASYCHGNFTFNGVSGGNATPIWTSTAPLACTDCHGMPPTGHLAVAAPVTPASCSPCHPKAVNADGTINLLAAGHLNGKPDTAALGCASCHGDPARTGTLPGTDANLASAPPVAPAGAPAFAVGAHQGHLNPTVASYITGPVACGECHVVPTDSSHATSPPALKVVFGTLARTGGATPAWDPASTGCAASYCHGNFSFNGVTGSNATPLWTTTALLTCASCHAMPPAGHPAFTGTPTAASCFQCHPQSVNPDGTIKTGGGHLNGKADGGDCTSCHRDPPATGRHGEEDHLRLRCDACHPTGYTSTIAVAAFHENGVVDLASQAGYSCGLHGCPTGTVGTCTNSCHTQAQRW